METKLEREVRFLRAYAIAATLIGTALVFSAFKLHDKKSEFEELPVASDWIATRGALRISSDHTSTGPVAAIFAMQLGPQTSEIRRLYEADQKEREKDFTGLTAEEIEMVNKRDAQRRERTRDLLARGMLQTGEDHRFAAFIFQHGDTAEDILLAHVLAVTGIARGDSESRWIAAATLDRYLHRQNQPQIFGTQFLGQTAEIKWTQEPFNRDLLTESIRREFCVPSLPQQAVILDAMNKRQTVVPPRVCP